MSSEPYYFPYFRARESELLAVSSELSELAKHGRVVPIFEPVKSQVNRLQGMLTQFQSNGLTSIVVENPTVGALIGQVGIIRPLVSATQSVPGFIVSGNTTRAQLAQFVQSYPSSSLAIIHRSSHLTASVVTAIVAPVMQHVCHIFECDEAQYVNGVQGGFRVKLKDVFEAQERNADYPSHSSFGDLPFTHTAQGFQGFGDYLTAGKTYSEKGWSPYAVAIHVTRDTGARTLECWHFLSTSNQTQANPNGKQLEAIDALFAAIQLQPNLFLSTRGLGDFRQIFTSKNATNLATLKRFSMRHHLELMMHLI